MRTQQQPAARPLQRPQLPVPPPPRPFAGQLPPPCCDGDSSCGPCGPAALCLQCKKAARALLDLAGAGDWPPVHAALAQWPKLINYVPEMDEASQGAAAPPPDGLDDRRKAEYRKHRCSCPPRRSLRTCISLES